VQDRFWYNFTKEVWNNLNLNIMEHSKDSSKGREDQSSSRKGSDKSENKGSRTSKSDNKGKGSAKK
jgi:hypothetical protein